MGTCISNVSKHKAWKFSLVSERELFFPFFAGMFIRYRFISRHLCNVLLWRCLLCCPWFLWPSASTPRIIFFKLEDSDMHVTMPFISISHLERCGTCCPWLGVIPSCCLFFRAGFWSTAEVHAALLCCGQISWLRHMGQSSPNLNLPTSFWRDYAFKS